MPNDVVQFDYISIGPSVDGAKYVLMFRDDHAEFKWLFAFAVTATRNASTSAIDWCASFGVPNGHMSDGPTHFKNETVRSLKKSLKVPHHFTLPYNRPSNGSVVRLRKELFRTFRAIVSKLQMGFDEWPDFLSVVHSAFNNVRSPQRGNVSPITTFIGMEPTPPISTFVGTVTGSTVDLNDVDFERILNAEKLLEYCPELHTTAQADLQSNQKRSRDRASPGKLANFTEADFVLVARSDFNAGEKLALRWHGPYLVIKARSDHVYKVEDLRNGQRDDVDASLLKFYSDASLNESTVLSHVQSCENGMILSRLMGLQTGPNGPLVQVRWKGLPPSEDTYEPLSWDHEDVPQMLDRLRNRKTLAPELVAPA